MDPADGPWRAEQCWDLGSLNTRPLQLGPAAERVLLSRACLDSNLPLGRLFHHVLVEEERFPRSGFARYLRAFIGAATSQGTSPTPTCPTAAAAALGARQRHGDLFPCPLPFRPIASPSALSARSRRRFSIELDSQRWVNLVVVYFNWLALGSPNYLMLRLYRHRGYHQ